MPLTIRGRQIRFSLTWLKPPPLPPDGNMTLFEHLRELRYRLVIASLAIIVAVIACFSVNGWLYHLLLNPYERAKALALAKNPDMKLEVVINGVFSPFTTSLKISLIAGLLVSAPVWLYQLWAFIVPGLLAKEKKWTLIIVGAASPLFAAGVVTAYYVLPKGMAVMLLFTPDEGVTNLQDIATFMSFITRVMLVFGLAFEIPLFVLMLNIVGVVKAKYLSKYRSYVIFGTFVFAAIATPSVDPISMLLLALPMVVLFLASEVIAHMLERRKRNRTPEGELVLANSVEKDTVLQQLSALDSTPAITDGSTAGGDSHKSISDALGKDLT